MKRRFRFSIARLMAVVLIFALALAVLRDIYAQWGVVVLLALTMLLLAVGLFIFWIFLVVKSLLRWAAHAGSLNSDIPSTSMDSVN